MDGKTEGVSFVVTAYNKERYLEATLKSILAQEGDLEREFIVVDDGSSDRSVEIAEDLIGSLANGKVIQQSNGGSGKAQNTGVAAATLLAIKFLDGDDLLPPDAVSHMLPGLQLPGVSLVHGDGRVLEKPDDDLRIDREGKPAIPLPARRRLWSIKRRIWIAAAVTLRFLPRKTVSSSASPLIMTSHLPRTSFFSIHPGTLERNIAATWVMTWCR